MALAMKCDRPGCGQYYDYYRSKEDDKNRAILTTKCPDLDTVNKEGKSYDLCPSCMENLQQWLKGNGELEEAE